MAVVYIPIPQIVLPYAEQIPAPQAGTAYSLDHDLLLSRVHEQLNRNGGRNLEPVITMVLQEALRENTPLLRTNGSYKPVFDIAQAELTTVDVVNAGVGALPPDPFAESLDDKIKTALLPGTDHFETNYLFREERTILLTDTYGNPEPENPLHRARIALIEIANFAQREERSLTVDTLSDLLASFVEKIGEKHNRQSATIYRATSGITKYDVIPLLIREKIQKLTQLGETLNTVKNNEEQIKYVLATLRPQQI